jgi:hypothetical protein
MKTQKSVAIFLIVLAMVPTLIPFVTANWMPVETNISVLSPKDSFNFLYNYENSTVTLKIHVLLVDSPEIIIHFISYSLDGHPLVYLRNLTVTSSHSSKANQNYIEYTATTILKNLSEGYHTVQAHANDMSTSRTFRVDSHYVAPEIEVLSPANQTFNADAPLVFTVNRNFTNAHYWVYSGPKRILEGQLSGNSTLKDLQVGNYKIEVFATTDRKEDITAVAHFTISRDYSPHSEAKAVIEVLILGIMFAVGILFLSLVLIQKRESRKNPD